MKKITDYSISRLKYKI